MRLGVTTRFMSGMMNDSNPLRPQFRGSRSKALLEGMSGICTASGGLCFGCRSLTADSSTGPIIAVDLRRGCRFECPLSDNGSPDTIPSAPNVSNKFKIESIPQNKCFNQLLRFFRPHMACKPGSNHQALAVVVAGAQVLTQHEYPAAQGGQRHLRLPLGTVRQIALKLLLRS